MIEMRWITRLVQTTFMGADTGEVSMRILQYREGDYQRPVIGIIDGFEAVRAEPVWVGTDWKEVPDVGLDAAPNESSTKGATK